MAQLKLVMFFKNIILIAISLTSLTSWADVSFRPQVLDYFAQAKKTKATAELIQAYEAKDFQKVLSSVDAAAVKPTIKDLIIAEAYYELKAWNGLFVYSIEATSKDLKNDSLFLGLLEKPLANQEFFINTSEKSKIKAMPEKSLLKQAIYLVTQDEKVNLGTLKVGLSESSPLQVFILQKEALENYKNKKFDKVTEISKKIKNQNLFLARLYFGQGQYDKAITIYEQINSKHPQFIITREELAWAYLMNKNFDASLGLTKDLLNSTVPASGRLETRFLAAYGYLKTCHFDQVKTEMELYQKEMQHVLGQVNEGKKKQIWNLAYVPADFMTLNHQEDDLVKEIQLFKPKSKVAGQLKEISMALSKEKSVALKLAFSNYDKLMSESLLKMQFLRLELLTLMHQIDNKKVKTSDMLTEVTQSKKSKVAQVNFATDGKEIWPDEVFKSETSINNLCGVSNE